MSEPRSDNQESVTTVTPMKRGLKVWTTRSFGSGSLRVTTVTPMKRGLKDTVTPSVSGLR